MLQKLLTAEQQEQLATLVANAHNIVITGHLSPDGDAIGSTTALTQILRRMGKHATTVVPNDFPDFLKWVPTAREVMIYDTQTDEVEALLAETDLVFCLDHAETSRMAALGEAILRCPAPRVVMDHHLKPAPDWCTLLVSRPEMCSACEVLFTVALQMGWLEEMTHDEAVSIYTGMMTDTGAFTFASTRPEVYEIISMLLRQGIDKDRIYRNVFYTYSTDRLKLMGYMLYVKMKVMHPYHAALMTLDNEERRHYRTRNGDTEGFVNLPLQIEGMRLSIFLRQDTDNPGVIRVSTRSVDDFPCNELCQRFYNGGGHKNASGGRLECSMDEAVEITKKALAAYADLLK